MGRRSKWVRRRPQRLRHTLRRAHHCPLGARVARARRTRHALIPSRSVHVLRPGLDGQLQAFDAGASLELFNDIDARTTSRCTGLSALQRRVSTLLVPWPPSTPLSLTGIASRPAASRPSASTVPATTCCERRPVSRVIEEVGHTFAEQIAGFPHGDRQRQIVVPHRSPFTALDWISMPCGAPVRRSRVASGCPAGSRVRRRRQRSSAAAPGQRV